VVAEDFNIFLPPMISSSKQKIKKESLELKDTIDQVDITDAYRILHLTTAQYTFFSADH
jgi:hypothetical protein